MRAKNRENLLPLIAVSLVYSGASALAENSSSSPRPTIETDRTVSAPVKLIRQQNIGYRVILSPPNQNLSYQQYLIGIDGKKCRDATLQYIKKLLMGREGSTVKIEVLLQNGQTEILEVVRSEQPDNFKPQYTPNILYRDLNELGISRPQVNLLESDSTNVDLLAKAFCKDAVDDCEHSELSESNVCIKANCDSMLLSQAIGDFESADQYLRTLLELLNKSVPPQFDRNNIPLKRTVKNLIALGKEKEAVLLCERLLERTGKHDPAPDPFPTLEALSLISDPAVARIEKEWAEKLFPIYSRENTPYTHGHIWFAALLEKIGAPDKALTIYKSEEKRLKKRTVQTRSIDYCQPIAACLYGKARMEAIAGDKVNASQDLEAVRALYKELLTPQQIVTLDSMPLYFPKPSDVNLAQQALNQKKSIAAAPVPTVIIESQGDFDSAGRPISLELDFPLAVECFSAIKAGQQKEAESRASSLIAEYKAEVPMERYAPVRQNLFCTILRVARSFADQKWYAASDSLLNSLSETMRAKHLDDDWSAVADQMIAAERMYNAIGERKNVEANWKKFAQSFHLHDKSKDDNPRRDYNWRERLRLLAQGYYYADETPRAKTFISRALETHEPDDKNTLKSEAPDDVMLSLSAAMIFAKSGDFQRAGKYVDSAFSRSFPSNRHTTAATLQVARLYENHGDIDKALAVLNKSKDCDTAEIRARRGRENDALVDPVIARLMNSKGMTTDAITRMEISIARNPDLVKTEDYSLLAKMLESEKRYSDAAKYYERAATLHNSARPSKEQILEYLQKAIACAVQSKLFDKGTLAKMYIRLGDEIQMTTLKGSPEQRLKDSLDLREKGLALMDDSDPEKAQVISTNSYIRNEIQLQSGRRTAATVGGADAEVKPTESQLQDAEKAAKLAVQNSQPDARVYLLRLATIEAQSGKLELAVEHGRKAISAYSAKDPNAGYANAILLGLPGALVLSGASDKAEVLFKEAIQKVKEVHGNESMAVQSQLAYFFMYYVSKKEYSKAEGVLDEIVSSRLDLGRYALPNHDMNICRVGPVPIESSFEVIGQLHNAAQQLARQKESKFALTVLNKILAAERRQFPVDDRRIGLTLVEVARVHSIIGDYNKAYDSYQQALPILRKYEPLMYVMSMLYPDYYDCLRKLGKQAEIDKIESEKLAEQRERAREADARMRMRTTR